MALLSIPGATLANLSDSLTTWIHQKWSGEKFIRKRKICWDDEERAKMWRLTWWVYIGHGFIFFPGSPESVPFLLSRFSHAPLGKVQNQSSSTTCFQEFSVIFSLLTVSFCTTGGWSVRNLMAKASVEDIVSKLARSSPNICKWQTHLSKNFPFACLPQFDQENLLCGSLDGAVPLQLLVL